VKLFIGSRCGAHHLCGKQNTSRKNEKLSKISVYLPTNNLHFGIVDNIKFWGPKTLSSLALGLGRPYLQINLRFEKLKTHINTTKVIKYGNKSSSIKSLRECNLHCGCSDDLQSLHEGGFATVTITATSSIFILPSLSSH
jgi:hypothetical protein